MSETHISRLLIEELALHHGFDCSRLHAAVSEAVDAYKAEQAFWAWRNGATGHIRAIRRVLTSARRTAALWTNLPKEARQEVSFFQSADRSRDPIGHHVEFIVGLLEEYGEHYNAGRGNQGKSRSGGDHMLRPLESFADVLMQLWDQEKGTPFGHVVERHYEADGYDPSKEKAPRAGVSEGLEFLRGVAQCLPEQYPIANFETVVRSIKRQSKRRQSGT